MEGRSAEGLNGNGNGASWTDRWCSWNNPGDACTGAMAPRSRMPAIMPVTISRCNRCLIEFPPWLSS